jgi:two-component system, LytTR family, response regulator LytT
MNIVIIEDEEIVANDLERSIKKLLKVDVAITKLYSVAESIEYLQDLPPVDLIFSDIQLGDGLSFDIFARLETSIPVIFCTAYDEYMLNAFKANGIDYILKPFDLQILESAIKRYERFKTAFTNNEHSPYKDILQLLANKDHGKPSSVLVYHQDKIIPVRLEDIAIFYLAHETVNLLTFTGKTYRPNKTLEELEKLTGNHFFRANRQHLVCRKAVTDVSNFFSRKLSLNLSIPFTEKITVSKNKASQFLDWLAQS